MRLKPKAGALQLASPNLLIKIQNQTSIVDCGYTDTAGRFSMRIAFLYRYPVKGLSPEHLHSVHTIAGEGFPLGRMDAPLRTGVEFDPLRADRDGKVRFLWMWLWRAPP